MDYLYFEYFSHRLNRLSENIQMLERSLEANKNEKLSNNEKYIEGIKSKEDSLTDKERVAIDFFEDDVALYDEASQFYRQSSFLMLFAFLEDSLSKICGLLRAQYHYDLKPKDLSGKGVMQLRNYIEKVALIDLDPDVWRQLDDYRLIRNILAHEYGELDNNNRVEKIVNNDSNLEVDDWGYTSFIRIDDGYLDSFVGFMEKLFKCIDEKTTEKLTIRIVK